MIADHPSARRTPTLALPVLREVAEVLLGGVGEGSPVRTIPGRTTALGVAGTSRSQGCAVPFAK
jgi:hypothetical protein